MNGGPSQIDLWDYKPVLNDYFDKDLPDNDSQGPTHHDDDQRPKSDCRSHRVSMLSKQHGQCGRWVSELLPHTAASLMNWLCQDGPHQRDQP